MNNISISSLLIFLSLICLLPGLSMPIMSIEIAADIPLVGNIKVHDKTQSILGTIKTLYNNNNSLVAYLILTFSVLVPILKTLILLIILNNKGSENQNKLYQFVNTIGKWSMADVFIVGVFLAYLATKSDDGIHANLHAGFYLFLSYCIISIIATQTIRIK